MSRIRSTCVGAIVACLTAVSVAQAETVDAEKLAAEQAAEKAAQAKQLSRPEIREQLTLEHAKRNPTQAAKLAEQLFLLAAQDRLWKDDYALLKPLAEPIIAGVDRPAAVDFIINMASTAGHLKKNDEQDTWLGRAIELTAKETGPESAETLKVRTDAAYSLLTVGRHPDAQKAILSSLGAMERLGMADLFFNTAGQAGDLFHHNAGQEVSAPIWELGTRSPLVKSGTGPGRGFFWFNLAAHLRDLKNYEDAQIIGYRALNELADHFGMGSKEALSAYDGLGQTLHASGQLASAEAIYQYAYTNGLKSLGADSPELWRIMNNRAAVLRSLRLPVEALKFDKFVYDKRYHAFGGGNYDTIISAMNMVHDLFEAGRWSDAQEPLKAIARIVEQPGYEPRYKKQTERWLAYAQFRLGEQALSEAQIKARDTTHFTEDADIEQSLAFLDLYADRAGELGLGADAIAYREHAVSKALKSLGDTHPMTFDALLDLARSREGTDAKGAIRDYRMLHEHMFDWANSSVSISGSLKAGTSARLLADDFLLSLARFATRNADAADLFAAVLDDWKTLVRPGDRGLRELAMTTEDAELRELIENYQASAGRFREIIAATLYTDALAPLRQQMDKDREALNAALGKRGHNAVPKLYESARQDVQPVIKPDDGDVIVDFAVIGKWAADGSGEPESYGVYAVVSRSGKPAQVVEVDIFDMSSSDGTIPAGRFDGLKSKMISTLESAAKGAKALYIIPADVIYRFDFAERLTSSGKRLGEIVDVHIATSRQAYQFRNRIDRPAGNDTFLLAGGLIPKDESAGPYLAGSLEEVRKISALAKDGGRIVEVLEGAEGTEPVLRRAVKDKAVVHLATHGFFNRGNALSERLMNAGITLSDASLAQDAKEGDADNVVYARELLGWDLRGAGLVVVSACETAVGGFGLTTTVRGLPLALSVAGAHRALLTVEEVDDTATMKFMVRLYQNLLADRSSYAEAFIKTKREAWAGKIDGMPAGLTSAYALFEH